MLALGKQSFDAFLVKVCAQLTGGYVAFHAFSYFSSYMEYPQFGGPSMPHRAAAAPATLEVCFIDEVRVQSNSSFTPYRTFNL